MDYDNGISKDLFESPEPPEGLRTRIMATIAAREKRTRKVKMGVSGSIFSLSAWALWVGSANFMTNLTHSGFLQFGALFFSDFSMAMANFSDFALSMIESFPVFSAAFMLAGLLFAIWSGAAFIDEASAMRHAAF